MKVIHLVTEDYGGAGRAARRISDSLRKEGIDSKVLVVDKHSDDENVYQVFANTYTKFCFKLIRKIVKEIQKSYLRSNIYNIFFGLNLKKNKEIREADIIHLHWVSLNYISQKSFEWIFKHKKVVLTLHDMWFFTGGCFYDGECGGYKSGCTDCPLVTGRKKKIIKRMFDIRKQLYSGNKVIAVGCSRWIKNEAEKSLSFQNVECRVIPNPIDFNLFKRYEKEKVRKEMGICSDKKLILFGAFSATSDKRKGFTWLLQALKLLDESKYSVVIFGNRQNFENDLSLEIKAFGFIEDDVTMAKIFSAADVFVAPSIQENLSNAVMESLACGTPVVAFDIGGMPDLIQHKRTGYLAKKKDADDLAKGIEFCCQNPNMGQVAYEYVSENYNCEIIGQKYKETYMKMMEE